MAESQARGRGRCDHHALVVDGQNGIEWAPTMQGHDGAHRGVDVGQRHHHGAVTHGAGQGLTMFGPDHDVDPQASGGGNEVRGPVGGSGQQQEDPGHPPMMVATHQG